MTLSSAVCNAIWGCLEVPPLLEQKTRASKAWQYFNEGRDTRSVSIVLLPSRRQKLQRQKGGRNATGSKDPPSIRYLRAKGTLISEPRFSTPFEMRFFPREKGKMAFVEGFCLKRSFSLSRVGKIASRRG